MTTPPVPAASAERRMTAPLPAAADARAGTRGGTSRRPDVAIDRVTATAYTIPTDAPESDGTIAWDSTTLVVAEVAAGDATGLGYTYADASAAGLASGVLAKAVTGLDALDVPASWAAMVHDVRNIGRPGIAATAISAVDVALWDLKARLLGLPLVSLLGAAHRSIPVYGSGGFTSYTQHRLQEQLGGWAAEGFRMVKMKVGRRPADDLDRVRAARAAIGPDVALFVDANGAYGRKQAMAAAARFAEQGVTWFEEPVSSDDLEGLHLIRDRAPAGMAIAAGEYGYDTDYFRRMLEAEAVDVLQADATRCLGITGFLGAAALTESRSMPLSSHCGPSIHVHACCAARPAVHLEWFHDHVRIEHMLFDGAVHPAQGMLAPDLGRPGLGLELRRADAERYLVWSPT